MTINASPGLVVVKEVQTDNNKELESGIVIPESSQGGQRRAKVIDIGFIEKRHEDGSVGYEPRPCKIGDLILFKDGCGWPHKEDEEEYRFLRYDDILAVLEPNN